MSVPASKRGVSEFEFYNTAVRLRVHVTMWLLRERRRLHTYRRLLDEGRITRLDVSNFYQSYKGQTRHFATHRSVRNLDSLYTELFVNN